MNTTKETIQQYWKLKCDNGRQTWHFEPDRALYPGYYTDPEAFWRSAEGRALAGEMDHAFTYDKGLNPNSADIVYRSSVTGAPATTFISGSRSAGDAAREAVDFYSGLQDADGHWPADYGGPLFLLPGIIINAYVTQTPFAEEEQVLMKRYMFNMQNADGGWGLHIEDKSTMFGTVMQYVALRLLGMQPDEPHMHRARSWILEHGGAVSIPTWGKFYLSVLGAYEWKGMNSLFPEFWLLPRWLPVHPGNYWCHARMVYLGMAYCYGHKVVGKITDLVASLREEIYAEPYGRINWKKARNTIHKEDLYFPHPPVLRLANRFLNLYEVRPPKRFRRKALDAVLAYIDAEDDHTNFINIGPVNKAINGICVWHAYGADSERFRKHLERRGDYMWVAEDGMKMQGYNGSQLWDAVFAAQAMIEGPPALQEAAKPALEKVFAFVDAMQVREEVRDRARFFRHVSVCGWPFSTVDHGWPITDCSSEGLKTALLLQNSSLLKEDVKALEDWRLKGAADLVLSFQNKDGGWASYEQARGPKWLEQMNPSEVFENIMIDYSYVECSSACMQGLKIFSEYYPEYRSEEIRKSIQRGAGFIARKQRADGSFYGSWAVCFCYGTWFGIEGLLSAGHKKYADPGGPSPAIHKACLFLVSKQLPDGGWGERFESCVTKEYMNTEESQVINTAWALLGLMAAGYPDQTVIDRGIDLIKKRQLVSGDWNQEAISGLFNHNCMITYTAYRNVFPIWALNRYARLYENK